MSSPEVSANFAGSKEIANHLEIDFLVLAGGRGSRLRPQIPTKTKLMVDIEMPEGQAPMITYTLREISTAIGSLKAASIVLLTSNHQDSDADSIEDFSTSYLNGRSIDLRIIREPKLLGTAGAIYNALKSYEARGTVLVCPGDVLYPYSNIPQLLNVHHAGNKDVTWATTSKPGEDAQNTGKLLVNPTNMELVRSEESSISEDDDVSMEDFSRVTSVGVVVIESSSYLINYPKFKSNVDKETPDLYRDYIPWCLSIGIEVMTYDITKPAPDLGTPDRYERFKGSAR